MNLSISKININPYFSFKSSSNPQQEKILEPAQNDIIPVYGNDVIRTNPAQLSLFHMHDFHGQNIRMERAHNAVNQFENNTLTHQNDIFDPDMPVDKLKLCSGDIFLGTDEKELKVANEFLNMSGVVANTIGNHECDASSEVFANIVKNRKYKLLGANINPITGSKMKEVISNSFIAEINGNRYGIIGLTPLDMKIHIKHDETLAELNVSNFEDTLKCLQEDIDLMKEAGINKIILISHLGLPEEQKIAQSVNDIDLILGGHTHHLLKEVKEGENLFYSPKGEPVLIMQVGRDGEHIGIPNVKFNELGQITGIQYNVLNTDEFSRSLLAKNVFEQILGKPETVGKIGNVENPPKDMYARENPHCDFIVDCMRAELNTDIAVMNSANLRGFFHKGQMDTRELHLITPFGNSMVVMEVSEKEVVDSLRNCVRVTMANPKHRPGILQVSGLNYTYSESKGDLESVSFIDKENNVHQIDINNPRTDKFYTVALDDFCALRENNGMGLKHRYENAIAIYDFDKDKLVADYIKKQDKPVEIKSDGRIKVVD